MRHLSCTLAFVRALAVGCGEPASLPKVSAPQQRLSPIPDDADAPRQADPRCVPTTGGDFAHRRYPAPLSVVDAEIILTCTTRLEFGEMPPKRQGQAFNVLFEQREALTRFQSIAAKAGPAGRLYALAAFQILAPPEADRLAQDLARDKHHVYVEDSDVILGTRPASDLVALVKNRQIGEEFRSNRDAIAAYYNKGSLVRDTSLANARRRAVSPTSERTPDALEKPQRPGASRRAAVRGRAFARGGSGSRV